MTSEFKDITDKLGKPKWYDANGYPRYCKFHPNDFSNIYADYVALMQIGCQHCIRKWKVAVGAMHVELYTSYRDGVKYNDLRSGVEFPSRTSAGWFHYGDPPSHVEEDHAGSTMNSIPLQVLEFWKKDRWHRWRRVKKYEIKIDVDWMN